jgi:putative transposase
LARHVDYIHFNPVKHGYVSKVRDWPHGSFHRFVAKGILPPDWGGDVREVAGAFGE